MLPNPESTLTTAWHGSLRYVSIPTNRKSGCRTARDIPLEPSWPMACRHNWNWSSHGCYKTFPLHHRSVQIPTKGLVEESSIREHIPYLLRKTYPTMRFLDWNELLQKTYPTCSRRKTYSFIVKPRSCADSFHPTPRLLHMNEHAMLHLTTCFVCGVGTWSLVLQNEWNKFSTKTMLCLTKCDS